jgi:hypothetical protein
VPLGGGIPGTALKYLFDEIDSTARPIQLVRGDLIGGAGSVAETAVHTTPQYLFGTTGFGAIAKVLVEFNMHLRSPARD